MGGRVILAPPSVAVVPACACACACVYGFVVMAPSGSVGPSAVRPSAVRPSAVAVRIVRRPSSSRLPWRPGCGRSVSVRAPSLSVRRGSPSPSSMLCPAPSGGRSVSVRSGRSAVRAYRVGGSVWSAVRPALSLCGSAVCRGGSPWIVCQGAPLRVWRGAAGRVDRGSGRACSASFPPRFNFLSSTFWR